MIPVHNFKKRRWGAGTSFTQIGQRNISPGRKKVLSNFILLLASIMPLSFVLSQDVQALNTKNVHGVNKDVHNVNTEDLKKLNAALNQIHSLSAVFVQKNPSGTLKKGKFFLQKPGKMRFEYDDAAEFTLLSDGKWLIYHDLEMEEAHYFNLKKNPLAILLFDQVDLLHFTDIQIRALERQGDLIKVDVFYPEEQTNAILIFDQNFILQGWLALDPQGNLVEIKLKDIQLNQPIPKADALFTFKDPRRQYGKIKKF